MKYLNVVLTVYLVLLLTQSLSAFETGKPSDIIAGKDYYRAGMDAGKVKDFKAAAGNLRYAYYQKPNPYNFFWYSYWLFEAGYYSELLKEFEKAPGEIRVSKEYGAAPYVKAADSYRKTGQTGLYFKTLLSGFNAGGKDQDRIAEKILNHSLFEDSYYHAFLELEKTENMTELLEKKYKGKFKTQKVIAERLYMACLLLSADAAVRADEKTADIYIKRAGRIVDETSALNPFVNPLNYEVYRSAVDYYAEHYGKTSPRTFFFKGIFLTGLDVEINKGGKTERIQKQFSKEFVKEKIRENLFILQGVKVFYFYISKGTIDLQFEIEPFEGTVRGLVNSGKYVKPDYRMLDPFPTELVYNDGKLPDGRIFFYPTFADSAYFGGGSTEIIVPYLLEYHSGKFVMNMFTGAMLHVFIHELYHGFESCCRVSEAHTYTEENRKKWPDWYKEMAAKNGATAEWAFYQRIFAENLSRLSGMLQYLDSERTPSRSTVDRAKKVFKETPLALLKQADALLIKANAFTEAGNLLKAEETYHEALKLLPEHPVVIFKSGYFYYWKLKNQDKALPYFENYLKLYPGFPSTYDAAYFASLYYQNRGKQEKALELISIAEPHMQRPYDVYHLKMNKIQSLDKMGKKKEAAELLKEGLEAKDNPARERYQKFAGKK